MYDNPFKEGYTIDSIPCKKISEGIIPTINFLFPISYPPVIQKIKVQLLLNYVQHLVDVKAHLGKNACFPNYHIWLLWLQFPSMRGPSSSALPENLREWHWESVQSASNLFWNRCNWWLFSLSYTCSSLPSGTVRRKARRKPTVKLQ